MGVRIGACERDWGGDEVEVGVMSGESGGSSGIQAAEFHHFEEVEELAAELEAEALRRGRFCVCQRPSWRRRAS